MITLREVNSDNFHAISKLKVKKEQTEFVGSSDWILALTYAHRDRNANVLAITLNNMPIGLIMTSEIYILDGKEVEKWLLNSEHILMTQDLAKTIISYENFSLNLTIAVTILGVGIG